MRSTLRSVAEVVALSALLAGCAFDPGQPWAELAIEAEAAIAPPSDRLDDAGRLLTNEGYAVDLERIEVLVARVAVRWTEGASAAEATATFDPADPPAGYTACHNGHCHTTDAGDLVDYETIEASLTGPQVSTRTVAVYSATDAVVAVDSAGVVTLDDCGDACLLDAPTGALVGVDLLLETVRVEGRVFDATDTDRLGAPDGVRFAGTWEVDTSLSASLADAVFHDDVATGLRVTAHLTLPSALLDDIAFDSVLVVPPPAGDGVQPLGASLPVETAVAATVGERATLEASLQRFTP